MVNKVVVASLLILTSAVCFASVESSLVALQSVLLTRILPVFAVMAFGFAAFQFFIGNPHAREYFLWAVVGSAILFGAQSIVDLIARTVQ